MRLRWWSRIDPRSFPTSGLLTILLLSISWCGCEKPPPEKKEVIRPVKIHKIGSLVPEAVLEYPGTIRAHQTAEMGFEVSGRMIERRVKEGDRVKKGDVLARLDPTDYLAQLKVAQANLEKARADLARNESIFKEDPGAISKEEIEATRRVVKVTEAQLEVAQKAVDDTALRAPFDGVVSRRLVDDFANVQAKEPVLIVVDLSLLEIDVAVPERDYVRRKQPIESKEELTKRLAPKVIVSALPDREFDATVSEYSMTADPVTRTFSVRLQFKPSDDVRILPGMTARVRIVIDPESAYSVPVTAVREGADKRPYVWHVDARTMQVSKRPVELGPTAGDRVLLRSGVKEGELVAISGVTLLREGMKVRQYKTSTSQ